MNNLLNHRGLFAYRKPIGQAGGRTLEGRIGRKIIDNRLTVKNYTSLEKYDGTSIVRRLRDRCGRCYSRKGDDAG